MVATMDLAGELEAAQGRYARLLDEMAMLYRLCAKLRQKNPHTKEESEAEESGAIASAEAKPPTLRVLRGRLGAEDRAETFAAGAARPQLWLIRGGRA